MQNEDDMLTPAEEPAWSFPDAAQGGHDERPHATSAPIGRLGTSLASLMAENGVASAEQLEQALAEAQESGEGLSEVVLRRGWITQAELADLFARRWNLTYVALCNIDVEESARTLISREESERLGACPIAFKDGVPLVAIAEPNEERFAAVRERLDAQCAFVVTTLSALEALIAENDAAAADPEAASFVSVPAAPPPLTLTEHEDGPPLTLTEHEDGAPVDPEPATSAAAPPPMLPMLAPAEPDEDSAPVIEQLDQLLERLLAERVSSRDELITYQQKLAELGEEQARAQENIRIIEAKLSQEDQLLDSMRAKLSEFTI